MMYYHLEYLFGVAEPPLLGVLEVEGAPSYHVHSLQDSR